MRLRRAVYRTDGSGNKFLEGRRSMRRRALLFHLPFSCVVRAGRSFTRRGRRFISLFTS